MEQKEVDQLIAQEYLHLQAVIEEFDAKALTIKAWCVTVCFAAISAAFAYDVPCLLVLASLSSLLFWFIEGNWKAFQFAYYERSHELEEFFRGERKNLHPMQIGASWYEHWKKGGRRRLIRIMRWPHVAMPYFYVFVFGLGLFLWQIQ